MEEIPVIISDYAASEIETILLLLETTKGKETADSFMNRFLEYWKMVGKNPYSRPKVEIGGDTFYRFAHPAWNYVIFYSIVNDQAVIYTVSGL